MARSIDIERLESANEDRIPFPVAKAAAIKAYSRIGRASSFDVSGGGAPDGRAGEGDVRGISANPDDQ